MSRANSFSDRNASRATESVFKGATLVSSTVAHSTMEPLPHRTRVENPNRRRKPADVIRSTLAACISKMEGIPNEVLSQILVDYMQDYFSTPRELGGELPPVLSVCRGWRVIALRNPSCWTRLSVQFDGGYRVGYGSRDIPSRKSQGRAAQDDLIRYFKLARGRPIDVYFCFFNSPSSAASSSLVPWLGKNLPPLRSFRSDSCFSSTWSNAPKDSLAHLTYLRTSGVSGQVNLKLPPLPNLRFIHISGSPWNLLTQMRAPRLQGIHAIHEWIPLDHQTGSVLKQFPELVEFGMRFKSIHYEHRNMEDSVNCTIEHNNIRRIHFLDQHRPSGRALLRGIAAQKHFPLLTELILEDTFVEMMLSEASADWTFESITSLLVIGEDISHCDDDGITRPSLLHFWSWFPNLVELSFDAYHSYRGEMGHLYYYRRDPIQMEVVVSFPFVEDLGLFGRRAPTTRSPLIQELIFSLSSEPGADQNSSLHLTKLKRLSLQRLELNMSYFTHLPDFLRIRQPKEGTSLACHPDVEECLLTITESWFTFETKHLPRSPFEIDEMGFKEFKEVVDGLMDFDASQGRL
jgi:hypothetical protein